MTPVLDLAVDLEKVAHGELSADTVIERHRAKAADSRVEAVLSNLSHFASDADIRARDPKYREMQLAELSKLVTLLRKDMPVESIARITFVHVS